MTPTTLAALLALLAPSAASSAAQVSNTDGPPSPDRDREATQFVVRAARAEDGAPIEGATVWAVADFRVARVEWDEPELAIGSARTDEAGLATLSGAALDALAPLDRERVRVTVTVFAPGFRCCELYGSNFTPEEGHAGTLVANAFLEPGDVHVVRAIDAAARPIADAQIELFERIDGGELWESRASWPVYIGTDAAGYFRLRRPVSEGMRAAALHPVYGAGRAPVDLADGVTNVALAPRTPSIVGRFVAGDGTPLPGFEFHLDTVSEDGGPVPDLLWTSTDQDGAFSLSPPPDTALRLDPDLYPVGDPLFEAPLLRPGATGVEVRVPGSYVIARVLDDAGRALEGFVPVVERFGGSGPPPREGAVSFTESRPGRTQFGGHAGEGTWILPTDPDAPAHVSVREWTGSDWAFAEAWVRVPRDSVRTVTLRTKRVPHSAPLELTFLDADGGGVQEWTAWLIDARSGQLVTDFDPKGDAIWDGLQCGLAPPKQYYPVREMVGEYLVRVTSSDDSDVLPVVERVALREEHPTRVAVRSPGWFGRVHLDFDGPATREREEWWWLALDLRHEGSDAGRLGRRFDSTSWGKDADFGEERSVRLAPGTWSWELWDCREVLLDRGTLHVEPRKESRLVLPPPR